MPFGAASSAGSLADRADPANQPVVFPSFEFAFFFPLVLALSWALMPRPRLWKPFILARATSSTRPRAPSTRCCWRRDALGEPGRRASSSAAPATTARRQRWIVGATVALDLGVLGVFKYYGFFTEEFGSAARLDRARHAARC